MRGRLRISLAALLVLAPSLATRAAGQLWLAPEAQSGWNEKPPARAKRHMVAAANPLAAEAGRQMLRAGGSAVDAAIAVQLVLGLVEPQSSGLGGGAFLLHWDASTRRLATYDGRETAPAAARPDRFLVKGRPIAFPAAVKSPLSIGVPGTVRLLEDVHRRHGKLPWRDLFAPAIQLAEEGFAVSPRLAYLLETARAESFAPGARAYFFDREGRPWKAGHRLVNREYASTLRSIAEGGSQAFYAGDVAARIVAAAQVPEPAGVGGMTAEDMAAYRTVERAPVCVPYRGYSVCSMGPPSSGGHALGQALQLIEPFALGTAPAAAMAPASVHLIAEALKLAFADRNWYLADPAFVPTPAGLLARSYIDERRRLVSARRAMGAVFPGTPPANDRQALAADETLEASGTSHISIVDGAGNALAMTTTIEAGFGSGRWAAGFLLNNELTDFSFRPSGDGRPIANRVEGGKRPRSSMSPTIVLGSDGQPVLVTGSAGGSRIIPYVLKTIVAVIDWKLDPARALALPNTATRGSALEIEQPAVSGVPALWHPAGAFGVTRLALGLKLYEQRLLLDVMTSGTQLIVRRETGELEGAADPRREGVALGD